jgi:hypothetical protein
MSRALLTIALIGACCAAAGAPPTEFSWDLSGAASQSALGDFQDTDGLALAATYYFDPVDASQGPYSLAAFLDPASRVSASVSRQKQTFHPIGSPGGPDFSLTTDDYTIGGQYVLSGSKWYAGGDYYSKTNPDLSSLGVTVDWKAYRALAGKYLGPNTSLELSLNRSEQKNESVGHLCSP